MAPGIYPWWRVGNLRVFAALANSMIVGLRHDSNIRRSPNVLVLVSRGVTGSDFLFSLPSRSRPEKFG